VLGPFCATKPVHVAEGSFAKNEAKNRTAIGGIFDYTNPMAKDEFSIVKDLNRRNRFKAEGRDPLESGRHREIRLPH